MRRTREQVVWDFVQSWLRKADTDFRAAEHLVYLEQDDYFVVGFHAQQAAEKYLKAFLVKHQVPFPKTHDIENILDLVNQADASLKSELISAISLTPFGVEFRYPGDEDLAFEQAKQALHEARNVKMSVIDRLKSYLEQGRPVD